MKARVEHTCRVFGREQERAGEATGGRDPESPELGNELQPCQMVVVVVVPEDRQTGGMLIEDRTVAGYMTLENATDKRRNDWTTVAVERRLTGGVSMKVGDCRQSSTTAAVGEDGEDWVSRCSTTVVDECPDRQDLTLSPGCRRAKLQSVTTSGETEGKEIGRAHV